MLRPNKGLPPRLEGIEVIRAARAAVYSGYCAQPGTINTVGIIVHTGQVRLLSTIDPQQTDDRPKGC